MRLLLDMNVVVSRLLWNGAPAQLIDAARRDEVELCTCRPLLAELARILQRIKFAKVITASGMTFDQLVLGYTGLTTLIAPAEISPTVLNDPDDDHVLACAVAAKADLIVSGDSDLLDLKAYQGIPIETPAPRRCDESAPHDQRLRPQGQITTNLHPTAPLTASPPAICRLI